MHLHSGSHRHGDLEEGIRALPNLNSTDHTDIFLNRDRPEPGSSLSTACTLQSAMELSSSASNEVKEFGEADALFVAAKKGDVGAVKEVLKYCNKEGVLKKNRDGCNALHVAVSQGHTGKIPSYRCIENIKKKKKRKNFEANVHRELS